MSWHIFIKNGANSFSGKHPQSPAEVRKSIIETIIPLANRIEPHYSWLRMNMLIHPFKFLGRLLDRVFAAVGAVIFSQGPGFVTHYLQRLSGHVDEAARNVKAWQDMADRIAHGSLDTLLRMGQESYEVFSQEAARKCAEDIARHETLLHALESVQQAPVWLRSVAFVRHANVDIAQAAARNFTPNIPMDAESLTYAAVGLIFGFALFSLLKKTCWCAGCAMRKRLARSPAPAPESGETTDRSDGTEEH